MRIRLIVLSFVLALSACGSSSSEESAVESASETSAVETTTTTEAPPETTTTTAAESDIDAFCAIAVEAVAADDAFEAFDDPVAVEAYFADQTDFLGRAIEVVPSEMRADYEMMLAIGEQLNEILADFDYDVAAAALEVDALLQDEEYTLATERTEQFEFDECGIEKDTTPSEETSSDGSTEDAMSDAEVETVLAAIETEAGKAAFVQGVADESGMTIDEATCFVDNVDVASFLRMGAEPTPEQIAQVLGAFDVCDIDSSLLLG